MISKSVISKSVISKSVLSKSVISHRRRRLTTDDWLLTTFFLANGLPNDIHRHPNIGQVKQGLGVFIGQHGAAKGGGGAD